MGQFLRHCSQRASILVVQYQSKFFPQLEKFLWMSWQKYVFVVFLWPLIGLQNHLHSILTHSLRTAFLRFSARCRLGPCSSLWPISSSNEKFWLTNDNGLYSLTQFWFPLHIYLVDNKQVVTSNTGPILVFPRIQAFGSDELSSLLTTSYWICELWEFFSVFRHEILSDFNCGQKSCISTKFAHSVLLW